MKRAILKDVTDKYIDSIEKQCKRLPGTFDVEAIHDLRVDYKKLRAFLRLLHLQQQSSGTPVPADLKNIYQAAGQVRDLQLFFPQISQSPQLVALPSFFDCCQRTLFTRKENLVQAIENTSFKKLRATVTAALPRRLQKQTIQQFIQEKIASIHILLLVVDHENELHEIRKNLKDIVYTRRIIEKDADLPFPVTDWKSEEELAEMTSSLGDFNDLCLAVTILQSDCSNQVTEEEKPVIKALQQEWVQQKESQKQQLLQQVQQLQAVYAF
jgi:CHAD domain-containing protein